MCVCVCVCVCVCACVYTLLYSFHSSSYPHFPFAEEAHERTKKKHMQRKSGYTHAHTSGYTHAHTCRENLATHMQRKSGYTHAHKSGYTHAEKIWLHTSYMHTNLVTHMHTNLVTHMQRKSGYTHAHTCRENLATSATSSSLRAIFDS